MGETVNEVTNLLNLGPCIGMDKNLDIGPGRINFCKITDSHHFLLFVVIKVFGQINVLEMNS